MLIQITLGGEIFIVILEKTVPIVIKMPLLV